MNNEVILTAVEELLEAIVSNKGLSPAGTNKYPSLGNVGIMLKAVREAKSVRGDIGYIKEVGISFWDDNPDNDVVIRFVLSFDGYETSTSKSLAELHGLLREAKVLKPEQLRGKPILVTRKGNTLSDWRILSEAIG